jgi:PAS domain S-box-containing protein
VSQYDDGDIIAHAITDAQGRFRYVDDRFCDLLHRNRASLLKSTILEVTAERDRTCNASKLQALRERDVPFVIRKSYLRGDGSLQRVENHVSLVRDELMGEMISAMVRPVAVQPTADVAALTAIARTLLVEHRRLPELGGFFSKSGWTTLLAAYVLEAEGAPLLVEDLCDLAGLHRDACLIRVWSLVASRLLVVDGRARTLNHSGVRLSAACSQQLESYLATVRIAPPHDHDRWAATA